MKLYMSPASPFARKARIIIRELDLTRLVEEIPVSPAASEELRKVNPLGKIPALILDDGSTIVDSFVIAEYLDDLAGGGKLFPASGPDKWKRKTEHSILQGMLEAMLLCRYEKMLRPEEKRWQTWYDDQWDRAWQGFALFEARPETFARQLDITQIGLVCTLGYADFRFPDCGWRKAFPKTAAFHEKMLQRPSIKDTVPPPA